MRDPRYENTSRNAAGYQGGLYKNRDRRSGGVLQMAIQEACSRSEIRDPRSEILSSPADGPPGGLFEIRDPRS